MILIRPVLTTTIWDCRGNAKEMVYYQEKNTILFWDKNKLVQSKIVSGVIQNSI